MSAAVLLAGLLMVAPGPGAPVCEPGQLSWVDGCTQGQLPGEVIGRQIDGADGTTWTVTGLDGNGNQVLTPARTELAHTGSRVLPLLMVAVGLVVVGGVLVLVERDARRGEDDVLDEVLAEALRTRKAMTE